MKKIIEKFIINKIDDLSKMFPNASFVYGYDSIGKQHIIEVDPYSEYKSEEYAIAEFNIVDEFIAQFPEDEILFINNNEYITVEERIYSKSCSTTANVRKEMFTMELGTFLHNPYLSTSLIAVQSKNSFFTTINNLFEGSFKCLPTMSDNSVELVIEQDPEKYLYTLKTELVQIEKTEQKFSENNYAMAA